MTLTRPQALVQYIRRGRTNKSSAISHFTFRLFHGFRVSTSQEQESEQATSVTTSKNKYYMANLIEICSSASAMTWTRQICLLIVLLLPRKVFHALVLCLL